MPGSAHTAQVPVRARSRAIALRPPPRSVWVLPVGAQAHQLWYNSRRVLLKLEVNGSRWASPSSKRSFGQLPVRRWVRLPCTSATNFEFSFASGNGPCQRRAWRARRGGSQKQLRKRFEKRLRIRLPSRGVVRFRHRPPGANSKSVQVFYPSMIEQVCTAQTRTRSFADLLQICCKTACDFA